MRTLQETFTKTVANMRIQAMKYERQLTDAQMQDQSEKENFNRLQLMKGKLQAEAEVNKQAHILDVHLGDQRFRLRLMKFSVAFLMQNGCRASESGTEGSQQFLALFNDTET